MDLDAILPLLFVFFFFILPNLVKVLKKKKIPSEQKQASQKKSGLIGKIGEQISKVLQEIEQQQKQQQRPAQKADDIWQDLAQEDEEYFYPPEPEPKKPPEIKAANIPIILEPEPQMRVKEKEQRKKSKACFPDQKAGIPRHPLQNAVIWSEILGKPVALK